MRDLARLAAENVAAVLAGRRPASAGQPADPGGATMNPTTAGCPVHAGFDPLGEEFLRDPTRSCPRCGGAGVLRAVARLLRGHALRRHRAGVPGSRRRSARPTRSCRSIPLPPEVGKTLLDGGHKPQPSMVSLDPPAHGRLRKPAARAFTPRRVNEHGAAHPRDRRRAARRRGRVAAVRSHRGAGVPAADADHVQLHGRAGGRLAAAQGVVRQPREPGLGPADAGGGAAPRAADGALPPLPARAGRRQGRPTAPTTSPARCWRSTTRTPTLSRRRTSPRSCSRSASPGTRRRTT